MKKFLLRGFTLIELLIVIAIIGVLSGLIITNVQGVRERARDARRKSDFSSLQQSLRLYYHDAGSFPVSNANYQIVGCGTIATPTACSWGTSTFSVTGGGGTTVYMGKLPNDPSSGTGGTVPYDYYSVSGDNYALIAKLENLSDQDIADSQGRCSLTYTLYQTTSEDDPTRDYVVCEE